MAHAPCGYISEIYFTTGLGVAADGLYFYGEGKRAAHVSICNHVE